MGSFDGYADAIEGAIYLVSREHVPEAVAWIDSEMRRMLAMQKPEGHIESGTVRATSAGDRAEPAAED